MKTIRDTWLIFHRSLVLTMRQPTWVVFGMMLPVLYLVLFGPLLEGAVQQAGAGTNAFNWFVPGLIIQIAIFGTAFGGFGLIAELRNGVVERMRVTKAMQVLSESAGFPALPDHGFYLLRGKNQPNKAWHFLEELILRRFRP